MYVIIAGAGGKGLALANLLLKERHKVALIDLDEERCQKVAEQLDTLVINGDATDVDILKKAEIEKADAFIALSDEDSVNVLATFVAKTLGVKEIIAVTKEPRHTKVYLQMGVTTVFSPNVIIARALRDSLLRPSLSKMTLLGGPADVIETSLTEDSKIIGKEVTEVFDPSEFHVATIYRDDELIFPKPGIFFKPGDHVVILAKTENIEKLMKMINNNGK